MELETSMVELLHALARATALPSDTTVSGVAAMARKSWAILRYLSLVAPSNADPEVFLGAGQGAVKHRARALLSEHLGIATSVLIGEELHGAGTQRLGIVDIDALLDVAPGIWVAPANTTKRSRPDYLFAAGGVGGPASHYVVESKGSSGLRRGLVRALASGTEQVYPWATGLAVACRSFVLGASVRPRAAGSCAQVCGAGVEVTSQAGGSGAGPPEDPGDPSGDDEALRARIAAVDAARVLSHAGDYEAARLVMRRAPGVPPVEVSRDRLERRQIPWLQGDRELLGHGLTVTTPADGAIELFFAVPSDVLDALAGGGRRVRGALSSRGCAGTRGNLVTGCPGRNLRRAVGASGRPTPSRSASNAGKSQPVRMVASSRHGWWVSGRVK